MHEEFVFSSRGLAVHIQAHLPIQSGDAHTKHGGSFFPGTIVKLQRFLDEDPLLPTNEVI